MEWFNVRFQLARHLVKVLKESTNPREIVIITKTTECCNDIKEAIKDRFRWDSIIYVEREKTIKSDNWKIRFLSITDNRRGLNADFIVTVDLKFSEDIFRNFVFPLVTRCNARSVHITGAEIQAGETQLKSILDFAGK